MKHRNTLNLAIVPPPLDRALPLERRGSLPFSNHHRSSRATAEWESARSRLLMKSAEERDHQHQMMDVNDDNTNANADHAALDFGGEISPKHVPSDNDNDNSSSIGRTTTTSVAAGDAESSTEDRTSHTFSLSPSSASSIYSDGDGDGDGDDNTHRKRTDNDDDAEETGGPGICYSPVMEFPSFKFDIDEYALSPGIGLGPGPSLYTPLPVSASVSVPVSISVSVPVPPPSTTWRLEDFLDTEVQRASADSATKRVLLALQAYLLDKDQDQDHQDPVTAAAAAAQRTASSIGAMRIADDNNQGDDGDDDGNEADAFATTAMLLPAREFLWIAWSVSLEVAQKMHFLDARQDRVVCLLVELRKMMWRGA